MYEVMFCKISPSHGGDYKNVVFSVVTQCNLIEIYQQNIEAAHSANRQHLHTLPSKNALES
jgi:hypothetical protein